MKENVEVNDGWKLDSIKIELETFGKFKGQYVGQVCFKDSRYQRLQFNIPPEHMQAYLNLISGQVVQTAEVLAGDLAKSLGVVKQPTVDTIGGMD